MADDLLPGLCSVTLRVHSISEVAKAAAAAGLSAIEWGGDVHVPPGDAAAAAEARRCSTDLGLSIVSYGSYLFCAPGVDDQVGAVLDTVEALGTTAVRVWCPFGIEPAASAAERAAVGGAVASVAASAAARGINVYLEFHGGTLTASASSAVVLLDQVDAPNLFCAWQPPYWAPQALDADLADLRLIGPRLAHVHVYQWDPDGRRHRLADGAGTWPSRLADAMGASAAPFAGRAALLEFVTADDPTALAADAATLRSWLSDRDGGQRP